MSDVQSTMLEQIIISLSSLQGLNKQDLKKLHTLADPETLETCAQQLARLDKELEPYRSHDVIGEQTPAGLVVGIRKTQGRKVKQLKVFNGQASHWIDLAEYQAIRDKQKITSIAATDR